MRSADAIVRITITMALTGLPLGCAGSRVERQIRGPAVWSPEPSLLFDRSPLGQTTPASALAHRPPWPSARGAVEAVEFIHYHERFVNFDGPRYHGFHDPTYRRVTLHREGFAYR